MGDHVDANDLIARLGLEPHPSEGGYFRETFRATTEVAGAALGPEYRGPRSLGTAIYFLLTPDTCSALHRLPGPEMFHFYLGDPVAMLELAPDGSSRRIVLGPDLAKGMTLQHVVPGGTWQGARLVPGGRFALLGTTMSPGFDASDFQLGDADALMERHPERVAEIRDLLPQGPGSG